MANVTSFDGGSPAFGVGLGGGGFLLVYYLGVLEALEQLGVIDRASKTAGASGGSLAAVAFNSGADLELMYAQTVENAAECRSLAAIVLCPPFSATSELRQLLLSNAPPGSYIRCSGTTYLVLSRLDGGTEIVSEYSSNQDLVEAVLASTHLPLISDGSTGYTFRGTPYNDGALTNWLPCPPSKACIRVSAIPAGTRIATPALGVINVPDTDIDPSKFGGGSRYSTIRLITYLTSPAPRDVLVYMRQKGRDDAREWAKNQGLTE